MPANPDAADAPSARRAASGAPRVTDRPATKTAVRHSRKRKTRSHSLYEREDELFSVALERLGLGAPRASASLAVRFALALSGDDAETARRGFESLTAYLASLHRFGPDVGAALLPMYGAAEFPQAFARLAAVRGATCALRVFARAPRVRRVDEKKKPEPNSSDATEPVVVVVTAGGSVCGVARSPPPPTRRRAFLRRRRKRGKKTRRRRLEKKRDARDALDPRAPPRWWTARAFSFPSEAHAPEEEGSAARSKRERSTLAVFPPGSVRGAPTGAAIRVAQLGAATGACPRVQPKEDENASGGWRVLQASVASSHPKGSAEDDLAGRARAPGGYQLAARVRGRDAGNAVGGGDEIRRRFRRGKRGKRRVREGKETRAEKKKHPRASSSERRSRPRATWVSFHREVAPDDAQTFVASWSALPRNVVTCPGPDARADFADLVAVAEAAAARLSMRQRRAFFPRRRRSATTARRARRTGDPNGRLGRGRDGRAASGRGGGGGGGDRRVKRTVLGSVIYGRTYGASSRFDVVTSHERHYASRGRESPRRASDTPRTRAERLITPPREFPTLTIIAAPRGPWGPRRDANGAPTRRRAARVA